MVRVEPTLGNNVDIDTDNGKPEPIVQLNAEEQLQPESNSEYSVYLSEIIDSVRKVKMGSPTAPHLNDAYRRMMLSHQWVLYREGKIRDFESNFDLSDPKNLEVRNQFYLFENTVLQDIVQQMPDMLGQKSDEAGEFYSPAIPFALDADSKMVMAYQSERFEAYVKEKYPDFYTAFEQEIQSSSNAVKAGLPKSMRVSPVVLRAAGVELMFKKTYSGMRNEIEASLQLETKPEAEKEHLKRALSVLKATSLVVNPSGAFLSYAVGAMLKTEAMRPLRESIGRSVSKSQNSLLKPAAKKLLDIMPGKTGVAVIAGCTAATVAALYFTGVIKEDDVVRIASNVMDTVSSWGDSAVDGASGMANSVANGVVSYTESAGDVLDGAKSWLGFDVEEARVSVLGSVPSLDADFAMVPNSPMQPSGLVSGPDIQIGTAGAHPVPQEFPAVASTEDVLRDLGVGVEPVVATPDDVLRDLQANAPAGGDVSMAHGAVAGAEYTVKSGDCLSTVARDALKATGQPYNYAMITAYYEQIAQLNGIDDVNKIDAGAVLIMPPIEGFDPVQLNNAPSVSSMANEASVSFEPVNLDLGPISLADGLTTPNYTWDNAIPPLVDFPQAEDVGVVVAPPSIDYAPNQISPDPAQIAQQSGPRMRP